MIKAFRIMCSTLAVVSVMQATAVAEEDDGDDDALVETRLEVEAELEFGVETVFRHDDPDEELTDVFASAELGLEYAISDRVFVFADFTIESVLDAEGDRAFGDLGLYVGELGIGISTDPVTLAFGKISPPFGSAWETAPGYFGAEFAEEYELEEMLGVMGEFALGDGTLTASVFYADDTLLSDSLGTSRGRNSVADGGVGNTGRLDNVALQYDLELDETTLHAGVRHLSRGAGDARDERGVALGLSHGFDNGLFVMAEVARFSGWDGSTDDANVATIGAALSRGPWDFSLVHARRSITNAPTDRMTTLGIDYAFRSGVSVSSGLIFMEEEGEKSQAFGISVSIPVGL